MALWIICVVGSAAAGFMLWVLAAFSREQRASRSGLRVVLRQPGSVVVRFYPIASERKVKGTKSAA